MKALIINDYDSWYGLSIMTVSNDGNVRENEALSKKFGKYIDEHQNESWDDDFIEKALKNLRIYDDYENIFYVENAWIQKIK